MPRYAVVLTAVPSAREAARLSDALLKERLVACASELGGLRSRYWWKGKRETAAERLLILKTRASKVAAVVKRVRALHSYDVPEVIALPILSGNPAYLKWIDDSLKP